MLKRYPLDTTGNNRTNLVKGETHELEGRGDEIIVTRNGAFFNNSLKVTSGNEILVLNKDYRFILFWQDATNEIGLPVSCAFQIINKKWIGTIEVQYQVVGGKYQQRLDLLDSLKEVTPSNLTNTFYDELVNIPEAFVPTRHVHHINDVFGVNGLVKILDEIRIAIQNQSVLKLKYLYDKFFKLKQYVENHLSDIENIKNNASELNRRVEQVLKEVPTVDDLIKGVKPYLDEIQESISEDIETIRQGVNNLKNVTDRDRNNFNNLLNRVNNFINNTYRNGLESTLERAKAYTDSKHTDLDRKITNLNNKLTSDKNELIEKIDATTNNLTRRIDTVDNRFNTQITSLARDVNNKTSVLNRNLVSLTNNVTSSVNEIKGNVTNITRDINRLDNVTAKINDVNEKERNLTNQINAVRNLVDERNRALTQNIGQNYIPISQKPQLLTEFETSVNSKLITPINTRISNLDTRYVNEINGIKNNVSSVSNKTKVIENNLGNVTGKVTSIENIINNDIPLTYATKDELNPIKENIEELIDLTKTSLNHVDLTNWGFDSYKTQFGSITFQDNYYINGSKCYSGTIKSGQIFLGFRNKIEVDSTKNYRYSLTFKLDDGLFATSENIIFNPLIAGTTDESFFLSENEKLEPNKWYIFVKYVHGYETNDLDYNRSGVYDLETGEYLIQRPDCKFNKQSLDNTKSDGLISLYIDGSYSEKFHFYSPSIYLLDGNEPPLFSSSRDIRVDSILVDNEYLEKRINVLSESILGLGDGLSETNNEIERIKVEGLSSAEDSKLTQEEIDIAVSSALDKRISDMRKSGELEDDDLKVVVDTTIKDFGQFYSSERTRLLDDGYQNIIWMDGLEDQVPKTPEYSTVFAPSYLKEFTVSGRWVVPDYFHLKLAEVHVISGVRVNNLADGRKVIHSPSIKKQYVLLKGGETVPIEVGTISSFGKYVTNDGVNNTTTDSKRFILSESLPLIVDVANVPNEYILNNGDHARVVIYV